VSVLRTTGNKTVAVAMSGGVDSSVAAALLIKAGYEVVGLTMKLFDQTSAHLPPDHRGCCSLDAIYRAQAVCKTLEIPHYSLDFIHDFDQLVIEKFISEYLAGRTPNPCVLCNTLLKWGLLYDKARALGYEFLATGHYAQIVTEDGEPRLLRAADPAKDQSYALWGIPRDRLASTLLPLGLLTKPQVRLLAAELGLKSAQTPESQEICFIPDDNYPEFLKKRRPDQTASFISGQILEENCEGITVVGDHPGYAHYTIGQRKGLGGGFPEPRYVLRVEPESNQVIIGSKDRLLEKYFRVDQVNWLISPPANPVKAQIQIRYRAPSVTGMITPEGNGDKIELDNPVEAIAPGQSAVFYHGNRVLGGGRIVEVLHTSKME
jgi:tRNA-uridine 2-sulfurtransferase